MSRSLLRIVDAGEISVRRGRAIDAETIEQARAIVHDVASRGEGALREHAERLGDIRPGDPLTVSREALEQSLDRVSADDRAVLVRVCDRIRTFASAQIDAIGDVRVSIPGGQVGHRVVPLEAAGCYAPGGRFPLPSSVLMTVVPARVAGVDSVWVASPRPSDITLAAAALAGADGLLAVGGAQAVAAFAHGVAVAPVDVIVGPGNRWVTAAKFIVSDRVRIDMLAGPSELVVLADGSADAETVAADLLAQAEHDVDAIPILISTSQKLIDEVNRALHGQLERSPNVNTAHAALDNGYAVLSGTIDDAVRISNRIAPEHLQLSTADDRSIAAACTNAGAVFIGENSAEVLGDYGAGPNHTLPTGGTARHRSGLSVYDFVRFQTDLVIDDAAAASELTRDAAKLARLEGLEHHARAAERRLKD